MAQVPHVVVVCGYGCVITPDIENYLLRVADFCDEHRPEFIIFCGGYTRRKTAWGFSEARVMSNFVLSVISYEPKQAFAESLSYTTIENVENAAGIIKQYDLLLPESTVTFFCRTDKTLAIDMLTRHYLRRVVDIETMSWGDDSPLVQTIMTLYTWLAIKAPFLGLGYLLHTIRKRQFATR